MRVDRATVVASVCKALVASMMSWPFLSEATDGYFANAYGLKSAGMGGVAAAVTLEPFGGATNPAAMAFLGNQWQVSGAWFSPRRSASRTGSGPAALDGVAESGSTNFFIPEFGANWQLTPDVALGVSVYGNGLNTNYPSGQLPAQSGCPAFNPRPGPYNLFCGNGNLGVDAAQILTSPYIAWQLTKTHAIGIAAIIAWQHFSADGLQALDNPVLSIDVGKVTNNGHTSGWGGGARIGYMGQLTEQLSVGIEYSSRVRMGKLAGYAGLLAQSGTFDIPPSVLIGVGWKPTPELLLAADYQRIYYNDIPALANSSTLIANCVQAQRNHCLGGDNGTAFGWRDIDVWKIGAQYSIFPAWTVRAGYAHSGNPIPSSDVTLNFLAPAVVQDHYSAGLTYRIDGVSEFTIAGAYASNKSVSGPSLFTLFGVPPTTVDTISMKQYFLGGGYSRSF